MRLKNVRCSPRRVCLRAGVFALAFVSLSAASQSASDSTAFGRFVATSTGAGTQSVGFASTGTPIAVPTVETAGGMPRVGAAARLLNPAGNPVLVSMRATLTASNIAAVVARVASRTTLPLVAGMALYDLYKELGFGVDSSSGANVVSTQKPGISVNGEVVPIDTAAPLVVPSGGTPYPGPPMKYYATNGQLYQVCYYYSQVIGGRTYYDISRCFGGGSSGFPFISAPIAPAEVPASVAAKVLAATSYGATSAIGRVLMDPAAADTEPMPLDAVEFSGPATSPGTTTTTNLTGPDGLPDGSVTTTTTFKHTYTTSPAAGSAGGVGGTGVAKMGVITTTSVTTTVTRSRSGETTTSVSEAPGATLPPANTAPPEVKVTDPCIANPDRFGCMKAGEPLTSTPLSSKSIPFSITHAAFSSGSCPAPVQLSFLGRSHSFSYDGLCNALVTLKFVFMLIASYIAARIVADSFKV